MKNKLCLGIMILCMLQIMGFLYWRMQGPADVLQVEYDGDRLYFYYSCMNKRYKDDENIRINSFRDEETGEFYLFFPKAWHGRQSKLLLYGTEELVVNQQFYKTEDAVKFLEQGRYSLAIGDKFYVLNVMYGGDIPSVFIDLNMGSMDFMHEDKGNIDTGNLNMYDKKGKQLYSDTLLGMHGRGNYSWLYHKKKSYAVSLAAKGTLTGEIISNKWNLIGSSYDPYLIKNKIVYDLAEGVGLDFSPETEYVELYVSGEYMGTYLITTKIRLNEDSVDIYDLEKETEAINIRQLYEYPPFSEYRGVDIYRKGFVIPENSRELSGGYLVEQEIYDRYIEEPSGFRLDAGGSFVIQSPEYASMEQVLYMQNYMQEIENALGQIDGVNQKSKKHYTEYIDMDSFVKDYLLQEISKNYDMNITSQYFYKPKGENALLYAGPVWDFDNSMGTLSNWMGGEEGIGTKMDNPRDLLAEYYFHKKDNFSFTSFYLQEDFRLRAIELYHKEFEPKLQYMLKYGLEDYTDRLGNSNQMNQVRWSLDKDWDSEIAGISDFLTKRMVFLEEIWKED